MMKPAADRMIVKPAPDRMVREPVNRMHIPREGIEVDVTDTYWHRLLRDGDVVPGDAPTTPPPVAGLKPMPAGTAPEKG